MSHYYSVIEKVEIQNYRIYARFLDTQGTVKASHELTSPDGGSWSAASPGRIYSPTLDDTVASSEASPILTLLPRTIGCGRSPSAVFGRPLQDA